MFTAWQTQLVPSRKDSKAPRGHFLDTWTGASLIDYCFEELCFQRQILHRLCERHEFNFQITKVITRVDKSQILHRRSNKRVLTNLEQGKDRHSTGGENFKKVWAAKNEKIKKIKKIKYEGRKARGTQWTITQIFHRSTIWRSKRFVRSLLRGEEEKWNFYFRKNHNRKGKVRTNMVT